MSKSKAAREAATPPNNLLDVDAIIKEMKANKSFVGSQQNLYSYARLAWNNYMGQQPRFALYSTRFTVQLGTDSLAFITTTEGLPSYEALKAVHVLERQRLETAADHVTDGFLMLVGYIKFVYTKEELPTILQAAGHDNYKAAAGGSWDSVEELVRMAKLFMAKNVDKLMERPNMPASFPDTFKDRATEFTSQRSVFKAAEADFTVGIQAKFEANEAIYAALKDMTKAGKLVFKRDELESHKFTISRLLNEVRGHSPSGIKGRVTTGMKPNPVSPVANAKVSDPNDVERFTFTDADGKYELRIPSGKKQTVRVEAEGFVPLTIERKIKVGTMGRQPFVLEPLPVAEPPAREGDGTQIELI